MPKNILDDLMLDDQLSDILIDDGKLIIPEKCFRCKTNAICAIVPSFATLSKIGILINVTACPYYKPDTEDNNEKPTNK